MNASLIIANMHLDKSIENCMQHLCIKLIFENQIIFENFPEICQMLQLETTSKNSHEAIKIWLETNFKSKFVNEYLLPDLNDFYQNVESALRARLYERE